jgi:magnesium chelatase subunit I
MASRPRDYPFSAIVGQQAMKTALILNTINPEVGGVLIRGDRGTAKSTAVRALAALLGDQDVVAGCEYGCDPDDRVGGCEDCFGRFDADDVRPRGTRRMRVVELPVNATEDRVVGSIDLEAALATGEKRFERGILGTAHRNVLYVDEVNLLDDHIVDLLLDVAATGVNVVEREGLSVVHPARFILVGTMNPEEGDLRPQLLDRFGLCVPVGGLVDIDQRVEISDLRTRWDRDPEGMTREYEPAQEALRDRIAAAVKRLPDLEVSRPLRRVIAELSISLGVDGHRADLVLAKAAQAVAAFNGDREVAVHHIAAAADLVYEHRRADASRGKNISSLVTDATHADARKNHGPQRQPHPYKRKIDKLTS